MYEIREWVGSKKKEVVKDGLPNLGVAHKELKEFQRLNPDRVYSIFRSRNGGKKKWK